ncbi:carbohydrate kinase family protein [Pelolinea submarina]|uniref:Ribokinase n=1 Tax=Pelolinea submarina TaxID=913107 RepID=A0A347ZQS7_9CHLR|nr:carbohydrate kinase family protein [Pelolinea submarina]REG11786.1 ribokinase [Pelolinea submarina]BBB47658.1 cytidine kinase [Pelolinea submarina]
MKNKITTIGNLTIDDIVLCDTAEIYLASIGGNALFSAIGARIWDAAPLIVSRIGKSFPIEFKQQVKVLGINTALIPMACNDIRNWALYEPGGARQFVNHMTSGSHYDMSITAAELPKECWDADGIHVAPMPTDVQYDVLKAIRQLKNKGTVVSWDPHEYYLSQPDFNKMAYEMLEMVDLFLPSKEEVTAMCGNRDIYTCIKEFASRGPTVVAVKMSTDGSIVYDKSSGDFYHVPIINSITKDPTGAGDAYCGGFLNAFIESGDAVLAACSATVSSSYIVEEIGAINKLKADFSTRNFRYERIRYNVKKY